MRLLLIAFFAFALSGCWIGKDLYGPSDARPAIPPGLYKATARDQAPHVFRVSMLANGLTQFEDGDGNDVYGFAPLGSEGITFVAWQDVKSDPEVPTDPSDPNQMYGLVVRQPDGAFLVYLPTCGDDQAEMVRKIGGTTVEPGTAATCVFPTRASLNEALLRLPRDETGALKLSPIP